MQLDQPFYQLPFRFDVGRLSAEVAQFGTADWRAHPLGHPGNWALPLIAVGGDENSDAVAGPMAATRHLARTPYLRQVMAQLGVPLGRSRLMKLDARAEATPHVDSNYYWLDRMRVHVPVTTFPEVEFQCGDASVHMAPGECWIFDTWRRHNVLNRTAHERVHLVVDTVGSAAFDALLAAGARPAREVQYVAGREPALEFEVHNFPVVMSPDELTRLWTRWLAQLREPVDRARLDALVLCVDRFIARWTALWREHGEHESGFEPYREAARELTAHSQEHLGTARLRNELDLAELLQRTLAPALLSPQLAGDSTAAIPDLGQRIVAASPATMPGTGPRLERPLIVIAAPRSGSTLLFETLAQSPDLHTVGNESHVQFESIAALTPAAHGWDSNRLEAADATEPVAQQLRANFLAALRDRDGNAPTGAPVRLLEKTPKNALRIPFLERVFPDALYVYLYREPQPNVSSLLDGWQSGRFVTYRELPGWRGAPWSYALVPGWRALDDAPLAEIASTQWCTVQDTLLRDLADIPAARKLGVRYEDLVADPDAVVARICAFAGVRWDREPGRELPLSRHTLTPPDPDKWRRNEAALAPYVRRLREVASRCEQALASMARPFPAPAARASAAPAADAAAAAPPPFASVFTTNLPDVLRSLSCSLLISTYQAGRLIVARADGKVVNTHFLSFRKPMGMAADATRFYLGTQHAVEEFRNVPAVARRLQPPGRHDAVYVPRNRHVTGNIDIHEMGLGGGECWYVNTLFSCLCTLDTEHSFVPRWRPRFVSALAPEDRCHLNGLAMLEGKPRWLTALGETDTPQGWRANKKDGGILIDALSNEIVARGLSMPHSPRWYQGRLWFLESGRGSLATIDPANGRVETVARLPGFTRGLDFVGPVAFVGLSQLRETNAFTDIPVTDEHAERACGVWLVDIQTGATVGFLRFSGQVQEIFAVQALQGVRFPELLDGASELIDSTYVLPDEALRDVSVAARR